MSDRPELTSAVLLWAWDQILANQYPDSHAHTEPPNQDERVIRAVASELNRLELIDAVGNPTKEGRRLLGLI